jgi:hypothetical protein
MVYLEERLFMSISVNKEIINPNPNPNPNFKGVPDANERVCEKMKQQGTEGTWREVGVGVPGRGVWSTWRGGFQGCKIGRCIVL